MDSAQELSNVMPGTVGIQGWTKHTALSGPQPSYGEVTLSR